MGLSNIKASWELDDRVNVWWSAKAAKLVEVYVRDALGIAKIKHFMLDWMIDYGRKFANLELSIGYLFLSEGLTPKTAPAFEMSHWKAVHMFQHLSIQQQMRKSVVKLRKRNAWDLVLGIDLKIFYICWNEFWKLVTLAANWSQKMPMTRTRTRKVLIAENLKNYKLSNYLFLIFQCTDNITSTVEQLVQRRAFQDRKPCQKVIWNGVVHRFLVCKVPAAFYDSLYRYGYKCLMVGSKNKSCVYWRK